MGRITFGKRSDVSREAMSRDIGVTFGPKMCSSDDAVNAAQSIPNKKKIIFLLQLYTAYI